MKRTCSLLALLAMTIGRAQDLPEIIPPSPEATALAKYVDVPVSHYNGTPSITVPIHTLELDGKTIPIVLRYHAKGIQVEEIASRVGLGWAMDFGGAITRQIRGSADEYIPNGVKGYLRDNFYQTFFTGDATTRSRIYDSVQLGEQDLYPDSFMFNFLGYSGKFIFDQRTKLPIIQHFTDLEISPVWANGTVGEISGWEVVTPDGFKLHFGLSKDALRTARDKENILQNLTFFGGSLTPAPGSGSFNAYTAWYLMDITGPSGRSITFKYGSEQPIYCRRSYDKVDFGTKAVSAHFSKVKPVQHQISEILCDRGKIKFVSGTTEREDLDDAYALEEIQLTDFNNVLVKRLKLNHTYVSANSTNVLPALDNCDLRAHKRLFLSSVETYAKQGTATLPPYRFFYNSTALPHRFSNAQDTWGYYNGKNNGQYLTFFDYGTTTINREVDTLKSQAGMLTKIQLPTGGSINYTYEHNRAVPPQYFKDLLFPDTNPTVTKGAGLAKHPSRFNKTFYESEPFTIGNIVGAAQVTARLGLESDCGTHQATVTCPYKARLIGPQTDVTLSNERVDMTLSSGTYVLRVDPNPKIPHNHNDILTNPFDILVSWKENISNRTSGTELLFTSGNRIKSILLEDGNGGTIKKEYEYKDPVTGVGSGRVFSLPSYYYQEDQGPGPIILRRKYGARPGSPLTYEQGNHEGYEYVTEYEVGETGRQGKTEHRFTIFGDSGDFYKFPYHLATDNEWLRGKPLDTKFFRKDTKGYTLLKEIKNEYRYGNVVGSPAYLMNPPLSVNANYGEVYEATRSRYVASFIIFADQDGTLNDADEYNEFKTFYLTGGTLDLHSTEERTYDGSSVITNKTTYGYDYANHYQVGESVQETSDEKTIRTKTYYPSNRSSLSCLSSTAFTALGLLTSARPNQPVQVEVITESKTGTQLSKMTTRTNFKNWTGNLVWPENIQTSKNNGSLENRLVYSDYDDVGNPLEVSRAGGMPISYIWGHNRTYPVAKIENATRTQIENLLGNDFHAGLQGLTPTQEGLLRSSLSGARITTFDYLPLVGILSRTDPRGYTTGYAYDNFNRLEHIKDAAGHMIEQYQYHYKN